MDIEFELFCKSFLLRHLTIEQKKALFDISSEVILNKNDYLIKEGDDSNDLFIVIKGSLDVKKYDVINHLEHSIATVSQGESVGELGLLVAEKRSASAIAIVPTTARRIPLNKYKELIQSNPLYYQIYYSLSIDLAKRIKNTSEAALFGLQNQLQEIKIRTKMATLFINLVITLCLFFFFLNILKIVSASSSSTTFLNLIVFLILLITLFITVKRINIPFFYLGFTKNNLKKSVYESVFFTTIILILYIIFKWFLIYTVPSLHNISLFNPWLPSKGLTLFDINLSIQFVQISSVISYAFIGCFMQEIIRCGMQGLLNYFLIGKYKEYTALIFTDIIFSTMHIIVSNTLALIVFIPGLYFGWLFMRHKSIIGCTIAHIMLGTFCFFAIGIPIIY